MRICDWRSGVCSSDLIMVDRMDGAARLRDGIYVLRMDDTLMVKRVALGLIKGKFSIRSDNPNYPVWEDIDPALVNVIGRVIWTGRRVGVRQRTCTRRSEERSVGKECVSTSSPRGSDK